MRNINSRSMESRATKMGQRYETLLICFPLLWYHQDYGGEDNDLTKHTDLYQARLNASLSGERPRWIVGGMGLSPTVDVVLGGR